MDSQRSGQFGQSLNMQLDTDNSTDVKNCHLDMTEIDSNRSANNTNNEHCFEDYGSYLSNINSGNVEPEEVAGDGLATGYEAAGVLTRDEGSRLSPRHFHIDHNDDCNWQATGVHNSQGDFRYSREMRSLQTTENREDAKVKTDIKLIETSETQRPLVGKDSLPDADVADKENETRTPATNLKHAIGMLEENMDQLRNSYIKQEMENSR